MSLGSLRAQTPQAENPVAESGLVGELVLDEFYATVKSRVLRSEREIDKIMARSAVRVERATGTGFIYPLTEAMPDLQMVVSGKNLPKQQPEITVGLEGLRFAPSHALLTQEGIVTLVNRHEIPMEVMTTLERLERITLAPGQRKSLAFRKGEYQIWLEDFPHAVFDLVVLANSLAIDFDWETGALEPTPLPSGEYQLGFYLGARPLHIQPVVVPLEGALQIAATVSANEIVTVSVTTGLINLDEDEPTDAGIPDPVEPTAPVPLQLPAGEPEQVPTLRNQPANPANPSQ